MRCIFYLSCQRNNLNSLLDAVYRYAFSEDTGYDSDEEHIALTSSGYKLAGDLPTRKLSAVAEHRVFGLGEDIEEDKRE